MNPLIAEIELDKLSLESLREIYASSFGICMGTNPINLRKQLEYQREQGNLKFPQNPTNRLLHEMKVILNP